MHLVYHIFDFLQVFFYLRTKKDRPRAIRNKMGRKMRLELTTSGTTNQRSNQLSYIRHLLIGHYFARFLHKSQEKKH